jgi:transaldolase
MKFFLDTADIEAIKKAAEIGMCDGITTNPTILLRDAPGKNPKDVIKEIAKIVKGPISVEGAEQTTDGIMKEALEFSKLARNVVIKVPMTKEGLAAVRLLEKKKIHTNVTLVFSVSQALLAAKAGATYVSPFVGRLDDIGQDGIALVRDIVQVYRNYGFKTQIIVASVRSVKHVEEAAKIGADIATIPPKVFEEMWRHELTDKGIMKFIEDHKKNTQRAQ